MAYGQTAEDRATAESIAVFSAMHGEYMNRAKAAEDWGRMDVASEQYLEAAAAADNVEHLYRRQGREARAEEWRIEARGCRALAGGK